MIQQKISQLKGLDRVCSVGQIAYMDFNLREAKIRFDVLITELNISKTFWSVLSNKNRVTEKGMMITKETADATFVAPEKLEKDQTLDQLKEDHYNEMFAKGIPEFDFWWQSAKYLNLEESLKQGILLLDSHNFFNQ
jgi:hypothetical protein